MHRTMSCALLFLAATLALSGCAAGTSDDSDPIAAEDEAGSEDDEAVGESEQELMACWGDEDCNNMFSGSGCGGGAVCVDDMCMCW